eukprot:1625835-Lingulodinium_polyedra.AAC.1
MVELESRVAEVFFRKSVALEGGVGVGGNDEPGPNGRNPVRARERRGRLAGDPPVGVHRDDAG